MKKAKENEAKQIIVNTWKKQFGFTIQKKDIKIYTFVPVEDWISFDLGNHIFDYHNGKIKAFMNGFCEITHTFAV